jgi:hypothetical protein
MLGATQGAKNQQQQHGGGRTAPASLLIGF